MKIKTNQGIKEVRLIKKNKRTMIVEITNKHVDVDPDTGEVITTFKTKNIKRKLTAIINEEDNNEG